ncbi:ADP-ribosylglycohydrolase family protein [Ornithinimicrobium avium]|uniref:ADP-ribosylglycohydrolase n=1 Tax=Ornithinimicrobium avium TaxID=2283195 RepID=A0A345NLS1_9MICO|nr:ADP-ribosylglycohydrolase family protein [Ornithinimicrobium avium]AXH95979.1 hypothetical protein DV701_07435 [Ornithinimicrobium avium]
MDGRQLSWSKRVRGLLLGLTLGDAVGTSPSGLPASSPLRAGVSSQLAAFTTEGLIRASVRFAHKGICHPPTVVWHACCRWAYLQGIEPELMREQWGPGSSHSWPDGWLARVPALAQRRGSAPATVTALKESAPGTAEHPTTTSAGHHAVTTTLPGAALVSWKDGGFSLDLVRELAAQTHGSPEAHEAAAVAAAVAVHFIDRGELDQLPDVVANASMSADVVDTACRAWSAGRETPGSGVLLARLAPHATALAALSGSLYVLASFPEPEQLTHALTLASQSHRRAAVTPLAGALLGARHGADALPVDLVSRSELAWVMDTLARDLALELSEGPGGSEYSPPTDPSWWSRYPGW